MAVQPDCFVAPLQARDLQLIWMATLLAMTEQA